MLIACCLAQAFAASAWGKPSRTDSRRSREDEAKKACAVGDVSKGIEILAELFVESNRFVFVYNQGRCYQQNGQWEKAINRFEEFLRKAADLTPEIRGTVEKNIGECQAKIDMAAGPKAPAQPIQPNPMPTTEVAPRAAVQTPPAATSPIVNPGWDMRVGGIVTAAAGLAAIGVGVGFNLAERSLHDQMSSEAGRNTTDNENRRSTYQTVSIIGYSVGAAALMTGIVLYILGARDVTPAGDRISFAADLAPGMASLGLKGRF